MEVAELDVVIKQQAAVAAAAEVERALKGVGRTAVEQAGHATSAFDKLRRAMSDTRAILYLFGVGLSFKTMIDTLVQFQQGMSAVRAVTGATTSELKDLSAEARRLGTVTTFSAAEAARGMQQLAQAGFTTNQILKVTASTLKLAQAGELELAEAAQIASSVVNAFQIDASRASDAMDVMAKIANTSNADIRSLGESMKYAGPIAHTLGKSIQETSAAIGVLANSGLEGSLAGTGLRQTMLALVAPTNTARKAIDEMHIKLQDLDPTTHSIIEIMKRLHDANISAGQASTIFGDRAANAVLVLANNIPLLEKFTDEAYNSKGALDEMSKAMTDNLGGAIKILRNNLQELILQTGDAGLAGALKNGTLFVAEIVKAMNGMVPVTNGATLGVNVLAEGIKVLGVALTGLAIGNAISFVTKLGQEMLVLSGIIKSTTVAQEGLNVAMTRNPIALTVTAIATVIGVLGVFNDVLNRGHDALLDYGQAVKLADDALHHYADAADSATKATAQANKALASGSKMELNVALAGVNTNLADLERQAKKTKGAIVDLLETRGEFGVASQMETFNQRFETQIQSYKNGKMTLDQLIASIQSYAEKQRAIGDLESAKNAQRLANALADQREQVNKTSEAISDLKLRKDLLREAIKGVLNPLDAARVGMSNLSNQAVASADAIGIFGKSMIQLASDSQVAITALNAAAAGIAGFENQAKLSGLSAADRARQSLKDTADALKLQTKQALITTEQSAFYRAHPKTTPFPGLSGEALSQFEVDSKRIDTALETQLRNVKDPAAAAGARRAAAAVRESSREWQQILKEIDPVTAAHRQLELDVKSLEQAQKRGVITQREYTNAIALLKQRLEDTGDPYEKLLKDMHNENALMGMDRDARAVEIELIQRQQDLRDKGRSLKKEEIEQLREEIRQHQLLAQKDQLTDFYRGILDTLDPLNAATRAYTEQVRQLNLAQAAGVTTATQNADAQKRLLSLIQENKAYTQLQATAGAAADLVASNRRVEDLQRSLGMRGFETSTAREVRETMRSLEDEARSVHDKLMNLEHELNLARVSQDQKAIDRLKGEIRAQEELYDAVTKTSALQVESQKKLQEMIDGFQSAFESSFKRALDELTGKHTQGYNIGTFLEDMLGGVQDVINTRLAKDLSEGFTNAIFGGAQGQRGNIFTRLWDSITGKKPDDLAATAKMEEQRTLEVAASNITTSSADVTAASMTVTATTVNLNASSIAGLAGAGIGGGAPTGTATDALATTTSAIGSLAGTGGGTTSNVISDLVAAASNRDYGLANADLSVTATPSAGIGGMGNIIPFAQDIKNLIKAPSPSFGSAGGGIGGFFKQAGMMGLGLLPGLIGSLFHHKEAAQKTYPAIQGVLGESRGVNITGTQVAGHSNPIATILNFLLQLASSAFGKSGAPGMDFLTQSGQYGAISSELAGLYHSGGVAGKPKSYRPVSSSAMASASKYHGGGVAGSEIAAILRKDVEAVVPLENGNIPVRMRGGGATQVNHFNYNIRTDDAPSFRRSEKDITRQAFKDATRLAARNGTSRR